MVTRIKACAIAIAVLWGLNAAGMARAEFQAGAVVVDVTPEKLPVLVNGGMTARRIDKIKTPVNARALAVSDGKTQVVIVVVDSCMMGRDVLDKVKAIASKRTGVKADHLLISATHTHTAPASMGCLGTDADPDYVPVLIARLSDAIAAAVDRLEPAKIGFGKGNAAEFTALRRWIRHPGAIDVDPFGNQTVRANMHAGRDWNVVTGESGPEDPDLSLISIQSRTGKPIAVLANFSMHYFGDRDISADYFGLFCEGLKKRIAPDGDFVGIMSHGCSGDIWRRDYSVPEEQRNEISAIDEYAEKLADVAQTIYDDINYRSDVDVAMAERRLPMKYRVPDAQRLGWAQKVMDELDGEEPKERTAVYAREQLILHERQETEIVVQGLRIGDIGIATTPNETYAITGLKIKAHSPLTNTMVIELANGGDGYIPPPEQHLLGGYNTWAARSAGLEVTAEPRITEACIQLLEQVASSPRRLPEPARGAAAEAVSELKPVAWWRLHEMAGPSAVDSSGNRNHAAYEPRVTYYLEGPHSSHFTSAEQLNRAAMFAGGRVHSRLEGLGTDYSVSMWIWNGMPDSSRDVSGWMFGRGHSGGLGVDSDSLGIGGTSGHDGQLMFLHGRDSAAALAGKTRIPRWTWQHVVLVRQGSEIAVYLNGEPEIVARTTAPVGKQLADLFVGGRNDRQATWEGRIDEVAVFDRALSVAEVRQLNID